MADSEIEKAVRRIFSDYREAVEDRVKRLATDMFWNTSTDFSETFESRLAYHNVAASGEVAKEQLDTVFRLEEKGYKPPTEDPCPGYACQCHTLKPVQDKFCSACALLLHGFEAERRK